MAKNSRRNLWAQKILGKKQNNPQNYTLPPSLRKPYTGTILGIDPSLRGTGLALISVHESKKFSLLIHKTLKFPTSIDFASCLGNISREIQSILTSNTVNHVAIEQTIYVQNVQTAQVLGAARGAAIAAVATHNISITEYPPLRIKQAVVGYGRASKHQVIQTMSQYLNCTQPLLSDEADAAAVALCHAFTYKE